MNYYPQPIDTGYSLANPSTVDIDNTLLFCTVPDDTCLPTSAITTLHLHGYDGNNGAGDDVGAQACRGYYGSYGGACGNVYSTSGTGNYMLPVGVEAWTNDYDFPYVLVSLPNKYNGSLSTLRGFFISGNPSVACN